MVDPLLGARIYSTPLIRALAVAVVTACGSEITEPTKSLCATRNGVEVCVDLFMEEYLSWLQLTMNYLSMKIDKI